LPTPQYEAWRLILLVFRMQNSQFFELGFNFFHYPKANSQNWRG
jgi:hypothetical protein